MKMNYPTKETTMKQLGHMIAMIQRDKLLNQLFDDADLKLAKGYTDGLYEIEDEYVLELVEEELSKSKAVKDFTSHYSEKYDTFFLHVNFTMENT